MCLPHLLHIEPEDYPLEVLVFNKVVSEGEDQADLLNQQWVFLVGHMEDHLLVEEMEEEVEQWAVYPPLLATNVVDSIPENAGDLKWLCAIIAVDPDI